RPTPRPAAARTHNVIVARYMTRPSRMCHPGHESPRPGSGAANGAPLMIHRPARRSKRLPGPGVKWVREFDGSVLCVDPGGPVAEERLEGRGGAVHHHP